MWALNMHNEMLIPLGCVCIAADEINEIIFCFNFRPIRGA